MNRTVQLLTLTLLAAILSGCGRSSSSSKLLGAWELDAGVAKVTLNFTKDGKWTATIAGLSSGSASGTWKLEGNVLVQKIETDTIDPRRVGTTDLDEIITLDDSVLVTKGKNRDGREQLTTLRRIKK